MTAIAPQPVPNGFPASVAAEAGGPAFKSPAHSLPESYGDASLQARRQAEQPDRFGHGLRVTLFRTYAAKTKHERDYTLRSLADEIEATTGVTKGVLPWLKLATFGDLRAPIKDSLRHDDNVLTITGIEGDYDGELVPLADAVELLTKQGILAIVYTSPSHTEAKPRWRVLCPLSSEHPPDKREHFVGRLNGLFGGILAGESFTLSQSYYFGSVNSNPAHRVVLVDGTGIDTHDGLDESWIGKPNTGSSSGSGAGPTSGPVDQAALLREIMDGDSYHENIVRLAGAFSRTGVAPMEALERLEAVMNAVPEAERDARWRARYSDLGRCVFDIYGKDAKKKDAGPGRPGWSEEATCDFDPETGEIPPDGVLGRLIFPADCVTGPRREYVVKRLLARGDVAALIGAPGCGKSILAPHLCYAIAQGRPAFGLRTRQGRTLYVAAEDGTGMRQRVHALSQRHGDAPEFAMLEVGNLRDPEAASDLRGVVAEWKPSVVVIDTLGAA
ncbi:MAG TPA: AAA family ATPase, partial [Acetobacteraceae bacterium]|nr:AAA family ATPase [Acetobacteraceae bacterium]